jgi:hypothetical protein
VRTLTTIIAVLWTIPISADEPKKADGAKIELADAKAEVHFPDNPTKKDVKGGTQYLLETLGGKAVYLATANPWPAKADITNKDFVKTMFDNAVAGLEKSLKGKKLADKESRFADKYPARDVDLEVAGLGIYRTKWVMTPGGFVQLVVAGPKEFVDGAEAKKFMESMKIKD